MKLPPAHFETSMGPPTAHAHMSTMTRANLTKAHAFTRDLADCVSQQELIDVVANWLPTFIPAERASIALRTDPRDDFLSIRAMGGNLIIPKGSHLDLASSLCGQAFQSRCSLLIDELTPESGSEAPTLIASHLRSALVAPLISGGEALGTLNLGSLKPAAFSEIHQQMLEMIASMVASILRVHQLADASAKQAMTDELTGGLNRRAIFARLEKVVDGHFRPAVLYVDLDGFKSVNDLLGHCRGDEVLRIIASRTANVVSDAGTFGRVGGDEFLVVIDHDPAGTVARRLADEIRQVCAEPIRVDGHLFAVSVSVGVAVAAADYISGSSLVAEADAAMYQAKRSTT